MANIGDFINFSSLGTGQLGNSISKDDPGSNGSAYIMVAPSYECWTYNDGKPLFGAEPKQWTNFQYWDGEKWVNVYAGNSGQNTAVQLDVNCSRSTGNVTKYYNGPTTPVLFQAKRLSGDGGRTHCRWVFMQQGHAGETWYNSYIRGKKIYGLSTPTGIYVASNRNGAAAPEQLAMSNIQAQLPLVPARGISKITADSINLLTCLPLGYTE